MTVSLCARFLCKCTGATINGCAILGASDFDGACEVPSCFHYERRAHEQKERKQKTPAPLCGCLRRRLASLAARTLPGGYCHLSWSAWRIGLGARGRQRRNKRLEELGGRCEDRRSRPQWRRPKELNWRTGIQAYATQSGSEGGWVGL